MITKFIHIPSFLRKLAIGIVMLTTTFSFMPLCSFAAPVEAESSEADQEYTTIHINTDKEMIEFLKNCVSDTYSKNLVVELDADVDIISNSFRSAEVFAGVFHGNGHSIQNMYQNGDGYVDGLFRYITPSGIVEDVNIYGHVEAENDKVVTGGICGVNAGLISRCSFIGIVNGKSETGGIAGENDTTGIIQSCSVFGSITGYNMAGGIAGANYGQILFCENKAGINADSSWVEENDSQGYDWILDTIKARKLISGTDIGGIAGLSRGVILSCENKGIVGYDHNGYNIGGIAGRQSGQIVDCTNSGEVYGRKDVGGIVGQMEPYISVEDAESISEAAQTLHDMIDTFLNDAGNTSDDLTADLNNLRSYSDRALNVSESITSSVTSFVDSNVAATQNLAGRIDYLSNQMPYILEDANSAANILQASAKDLRIVVNTLNFYGEMENTTYDATAHNRLTVSDTVGGKAIAGNVSPNAGDTVNITMVPDAGYKASGIRVINSDGTEIETNPQSAPDITSYSFVMPAENIFVEGSFAYTNTNEDVYVESNVGGSASKSELATDSPTDHSSATYAYTYVTVTPDTGYKINYVVATDTDTNVQTTLTNNGDNTYTVDILDSYKQNHPVQVYIVFEKASDAEVVNTSTGNIAGDVNELNTKTDKLREDLDKYQNTPIGDPDRPTEEDLIKDIADVMSTNSQLMGELSTAANVMSPYAREALKEASVELGTVMSDLESAFSCLSNAFGKTKAAFTYVNSMGNPGFTKLDPSVSGNISDLYDNLGNVSAATGNLTGNLGSNSDILEADLHSINNQTNKIMQLFASMISDAEDLYNDESLYEDVSDELIDETTMGKVDSCRNNSKITGDIDVGGIAGSMAIDEEDPEGNAAGEVHYNLGARYLTKCIITNCTNSDTVKAKKDGAGGIVGYMNLGITSSSQSFGHISSTEGNYVGGIAGQSLALVRDCYSKVSLNGKENIGGICGAGSKISDCKSIAAIDGDAIKTGAIAGVIEKDENERFSFAQDIQGNVFVSETLGGIDGMSFADIAEQISYKDMTEQEDIPSEFRHIRINYYADNELVQSREVPYGTEGADLVMPDVPNRNDGTYGVWPDLSDQTIEVDITLNAEYEDNITTLSSDIENSDVVINNEVMPYVYVDGIYTNAAQVKVDVDRESDSVMYSVTVTGSKLCNNDTSKVRIYNPFDKIKCVEMQDENGEWHETEYKEYGSYLQVYMTGTQMQVRISEASDSSWLTRTIFIGIAAVAVILSILFIGKRINRHSKPKKKPKKKHTKRPAKKQSDKKNKHKA